MSLFYTTAEADDLTGLKRLHQMGESTDVRGFLGRTALHVAAREGRISMLVWLLRSGADFAITDEHGVCALRTAAENGKRDAVFILLAAGASPGVYAKDGFAPLHAAVRHGQVDTVRAFLDAGVDANQPMKLHPYGFTPLDISSGYETYQRESELAFEQEKTANYETISRILTEHGGLTVTPYEPL